MINDVNDKVVNITQAIEGKSKITNEIAGNVSNVFLGIQEVTESITQSSIVSAEIAKDVSDVKNDSGQISDSSIQVQESADALNTLSAENGASVLLVEENARKGLSISHRGYVLELDRNRLTGTGEELLENDTVRKLYLGG